jgi:hypothetical protein
MPGSAAVRLQKARGGLLREYGQARGAFNDTVLGAFKAEIQTSLKNLTV